MDEETITAEERLKQLNEERKALKKQVLGERDLRLKQAAEMRVTRDEQIEKIQAKLKIIQTAIFHYNKLGKVAKIKIDILKVISEEINPNVAVQQND